MAAKRVRILKARAAGTGAGGAGVNQPVQVAGKINSAGAPRSGSAKDADTLMAFARMRARARRAFANATIGSRGRL